MKLLLRLGVTAAVGALALAFSNSAFAAAVSPTFRVSLGGPTVTLNTADQSSISGDPVARIQFYVPAGFAVKLPSRGEVIGTATTHALVKDIDPGLEQTLSGDVVAIAATDKEVVYEASTCDTGAHLGAWMVRLNGQKPQISQSVNVPIFIDATSGSETQFGAYKLVACMRSPDLSVGDANRELFATKFDTFTVQLKLKAFTVPTKVGNYRWRSLWTPYTPGTATMNTAGNAEAQSNVHMPAGVITINTKLSNGRIALSGTLLVGGEPASGVSVGIARGALKTHLVSMGSAKTNGVGKYLMLAKMSTAKWFQAGATIAGKELGPGACQASFAGVPCTDATAGDVSIVSPYVHFKG
jgi:hypothetical protein